MDQVLPTALTINNSRANVSNIIIANSGALRFDLYAGTFTKNDQLTVSPFTDAFLYIPAVPLGVAQDVLPKLNSVGANSKRDLFAGADNVRRRGRGEVEERYSRWVAEMYSHAGSQWHVGNNINLTLGYVTHDVRFRAPSGRSYGHAYMAYRLVRDWATTLYTRRCHTMTRRITSARLHRQAAMTRRSTSSLLTLLRARWWMC